MTSPDPQGKYVMADGVEMPMGKAMSSAIGQSSLLYNEYPLGSLLLMCNKLVKKSNLVCKLFLTKCSDIQQFVMFR